VDEQQPASRNLIDYLGIMARGFTMGSFEIVPGISGGTMALILGIYEELIDSVKAVLNREAIRLLLRFKVRRALDLIPWKFLLSLAIGIFAAVFTVSHLIEWVLERYPSLIWAFFFGLVTASTFVVSRRVKKWGIAPALGTLLGAAGVYTLVGLVPTETPNTWWFWFLSGAVAICGLVLPGMSGSFLMVLLNKYEQLLSAVTHQEFGTLLLVIAGAGVGVVTLAQVLGWLLKKYHDTTVAVLIGMLIGSLRKLWPWQAAMAQADPLPKPWDVVLPLILILVAIAFILAMHAWVSQIEKKSPNQPYP
jgi:putative membrane protein